MKSPTFREPVTQQEVSRVMGLFCFGLLLRVLLLLTLQLTGLERTLKLTKDAFLYDRVGKQIADYYRSGGLTEWPSRANGVLDHMYEHFVGLTYFYTDDSMLAVRLVNALAGSLVCLVAWRMARYVTDGKTACRCCVWACFFPTQLYYSCLPVRDAQSTLGMALVFLGMVAVTSSGRLRDMAALPVGILMTAGFRTYVASVLLMLIPAAWAVTFLLTRSQRKFQLLSRVALLGILALAVVGPGEINKLFSTGKAGNVTDMEYWNSTRQKMNRGSGALYEDGDVPTLGESAVETAVSVAIGIYFFFVSVNPSEMDSIRQWMALPEVVLVVYMLPKMYRGARRIWRYHRFECLGILFIAAAITFAYSSVTTNAGPLMRWRLQVVNVYILVAAIGFSKRYSFEQWSQLKRSRREPEALPSGSVKRAA